MSGLCVTGLIPSDIELVFSRLQRLGVKSAQPAERDREMTLSRWHEQLMQIPFDTYSSRFDPASDQGEFSARQDIGRLWEQLASDIFIANLSVPVWGWADTRSIDLLPFWDQFDPQLKFILLVCSPERYIANVIETTNDPVDAQVLLNRWQNAHAALLHFSRSNPNKTILLRTEDAMLDGSALADLCNQHLKIPLETGGVDQSESQQLSSTFASQIATRLCQGFSKQSELVLELEASLTPVTSKVKDSAREQGTTESTVESSNLLTLVQSYRAAVPISLNGQVEVPASQVVDTAQTFEELSTTKQELESARDEKDRLAKQLDQVQIDLEKYFIKHQEAQIELEGMQTRLHKLLARVPGYVELDSLEIIKHQKTPSRLVTWKVVGLECAGRVIPELTFTTFIENGVACLEFYKSGDLASPFVRWPGHADSNTVTVTAVGDGVTAPERARVLQTLSTSDWRLVRMVNALLLKELNEPSVLSLPAGFEAKRVIDSLDALQTHLSALPKVFHFDQVQLHRCLEEANHEYLWFSFSNVLFGERQASRFEFRFSSVNVPAGNFGSNPRLEFYADAGSELFEGWFEESSDDHGSKLELRFAQPSAMDMDVWSKLPANDRELILALIAELPVFMGVVQEDHRNLKRPWNEWIELAQTVHAWALLHTQPFGEDSDAEYEADLDDDGDVDASGDIQATPQRLKRGASRTVSRTRAKSTKSTTTARRTRRGAAQ